MLSSPLSHQGHLACGRCCVSFGRVCPEHGLRAQQRHRTRKNRLAGAQWRRQAPQRGEASPGPSLRPERSAGRGGQDKPRPADVRTGIRFKSSILDIQLGEPCPPRLGEAVRQLIVIVQQLIFYGLKFIRSGMYFGASVMTCPPTAPTKNTGKNPVKRAIQRCWNFLHSMCNTLRVQIINGLTKNRPLVDAFIERGQLK